MQEGTLVQFVETDHVDPVYWGRVGIVVATRETYHFLYGLTVYYDVLVEDHIIRECAEGSEILEVDDEPG